MKQESTPSDNLYYIQNISRGYVGNSVMWWKHDNCGYVCDIRKARVWTREEAEQHCKMSSDLIMWEKEYIDSKIQYHIDMQTIYKNDPDSGYKKYNITEKKWEMSKDIIQINIPTNNYYAILHYEDGTTEKTNKEHGYKIISDRKFKLLNSNMSGEIYFKNDK